MRLEFIPKSNPLGSIYLLNAEAISEIRAIGEFYELIDIYEGFLEDQIEEISALSLIEPRLTVLESKLYRLQRSAWNAKDPEKIIRRQLAYRNVRYFRESAIKRLKDLRNLPREKKQKYERTWYPEILEKAE